MEYVYSATCPCPVCQGKPKENSALQLLHIALNEHKNTLARKRLAAAQSKQAYHNAQDAYHTTLLRIEQLEDAIKRLSTRYDDGTPGL